MANTEIVPKTELEELQYQSGKVADESLQSTRNMLSMLEESEEAGQRTIENLELQGEKLNRIQDGMDHINNDVKTAEKSLYNMRKCCCIIPWKKVSTEDENDIALKNRNLTEVGIVSNQPRSFNGKHERKGSGAVSSQSGYITRITNDAREEEMDANMCQVNSILDNLHDMAKDMGTEIERQNKQIDHINEIGDDNTIRLGQVNVSANTLLKS